MGKQRKTWSAEVKEQIVLSVLRGEVSTAEAARQHGVNESLVHTWKTNFLEGGRARRRVASAARACSGGSWVRKRRNRFVSANALLPPGNPRRLRRGDPLTDRLQV